MAPPVGHISQERLTHQRSNHPHRLAAPRARDVVDFLFARERAEAFDRTRFGGESTRRLI